MADSHEHDLSPEDIKAQIAAARRAVAQAPALKRDTKNRRAVEKHQSKSRVNTTLLRGVSEARDEVWTIRAKSSQVKAVKALATDLSQPGRKISIAELMDEAMELLFAKYRDNEGFSDA